MWPARSALEIVDERDARIEQLFRQEYRGMVRLAYTLIGDNQRAEDVVQDGFIDVLRRLDEVRQPAAYLRTAVVSRFRSEMRRRRVRAMHPPQPPDDLSLGAGDLWDVLAKLTEDQRIAIVLKYHGRYRSSEIAEIMDIAPSTVRYHLRAGLAALREELAS
jgi:RNA polymerase sigma factor (sigma-70 family)